jgi:ribonucleoside-diphosphate reductase alpha subunit
MTTTMTTAAGRGIVPERYAPVSLEAEAAAIEERLEGLARMDPPLDLGVLDLAGIAAQVARGLCAGITEQQKWTLAAETVAPMISHHPEYDGLASRVAVAALHARTPARFSEAVALLHEHVERRTGARAPLVSDALAATVEEHGAVLDAAIVHERDFTYTYFGFRTLESGYLLKIDGRAVERPQYMIMKVALGIHGADIESALRTYDLMSRQIFTHATPTLHNAGTPRPSLSSCFLLDMREDSVNGIYDTLKQCALISKSGGGVGLAVHRVRARDAYVAGSNGRSSGLVPMLRVYNDTARYIDQCFAGDALVITAERGPVPIGRLYTEGAGARPDGSRDGAEGTSVVEAAGPVHVLSATGRWCRLGSVVRHARRRRGDGTEAAQRILRVRAGTTLTPSWAVDRDGRTSSEVRVTDQHQVMVLCEALDEGQPPVIMDERDDDLAVSKSDADAIDVESGPGGGDDDGEAREGSGETEKDDGDAGPNDALKSRLEILCERIAMGHVKQRLVDAAELRPGAVLCYAAPPEPTLADDAFKPSDWRMAGLIVAASLVSKGERVTHLVACAGTSTARFVDTYIAAVGHAEGSARNVPKKGAPSAARRWRISHPALAAARSLAERYRALLPAAPVVCLEHFVGALVDGIAGNRAGPVDADALDLLRWASLRLGQYAAAHTSPERARAGLPTLLSLVQPQDAKRQQEESRARVDGEREAIRRPWSIVHGSALYVPVESVTETDENDDDDDREFLYDLEVDDEEHTYVTMGLGACHNGGGKRKGAFAVYLEPWHADVFEWLDLKKNHGKEEDRARDLFYGLWVPDLFMRRVAADERWSLFCPSEAPDLHLHHGAAFDALYERYEREGRARRSVPARALWWAILDAQTETGTPYMLYKDAANATSNQQNLGTIVCSNLCTEVIQFSSEEECSVCNLGSIALPKFIRRDVLESIRRSGKRVTLADLDGLFDHRALYEVVGVVVRNIDRIIDINYYPVPEARTSNMRHRPMGIGVQGLADLFAILGLPWDSAEARRLNRDAFETIYYAAVTASTELAAEAGAPYPSFEGSPASRGLLHPDLWAAAVNDASRWAGFKTTAEPFDFSKHVSGRWDWDLLRAKVARRGMRNSLLVAPMPTASTSQILGNTESIEALQSNIFSRRTLAGEFTIVNAHLVRELCARGLWTPSLRMRIIDAGGSVQGFADDEVPADIKAVYRTAWEIPNRVLIDMSADRSPYVDQSQSLNLYCAAPDSATLTSMHFYAWRRGLKTGAYYLRTRPAANAIKFTVDVAAVSAAADRTKGPAPPEPGPRPSADPDATAMPDDDDVASDDGGVCYPGCESCSG